MSALNIGEILREFGEILGKYRILDERSMGSIGLNGGLDSGVRKHCVQCIQF